MLELLRSLEWCAPFVALPHTNCPACGRRRENGHAPDCRLDRAIRGAVSVEPLRPPLTTEEKARALGYARNASAWVDADGVWCSDALIDVRWTEHLIRGQQRAREAASEPTVDEMARDLGLTRGPGRWISRSSGVVISEEHAGWYRMGGRGVVYPSDEAAMRAMWEEQRPSIDEMAREMGYQRCQDCGRWRGPDITRDCYPDDRIPSLYREHKAKQIDATLAGKRVGPWLTPPAPKVYEASGPPTDPSALAAWLYARVVPGQTRAVAGSEEFVVLTKATHRTGGFTVAGARAEPASYPAHAMHRPITRLLNPDGTVLWEAK